MDMCPKRSAQSANARQCIDPIDDALAYQARLFNLKDGGYAHQVTEDDEYYGDDIDYYAGDYDEQGYMCAEDDDQVYSEADDGIYYQAVDLTSYLRGVGRIASRSLETT